MLAPTTFQSNIGEGRHLTSGRLRVFLHHFSCILNWSRILVRISCGILFQRRNAPVIVTPIPPYRHLALGNPASLEILEQLLFTSKGNFQRIIANFEQLAIQGYKIEQIYLASGARIKKLAKAASDIYSLFMLANTPAQEEEALSLKLALVNQYKEQIFRLERIEDLDQIIGWDMLSKIMLVTEELDEAIHSFLIPDKVNCAQWYVNYRYLTEYSPEGKLKSYVVPCALSIMADRAPFFPEWFIAAYPEIVHWALRPQSKCSLYAILSEQESRLEWYQLRTILSEYGDQGFSYKWQYYRQRLFRRTVAV